MTNLFSVDRPVIAMIHVGALPGTPAAQHTLAELEAQVADQAARYREHGAHAIALENMHDVPYLRGQVGPEIVAAMTRLCLAARRAAPDLPLGVQVLAAANREALAVALAADLQFVRVEGFVFAHVADEGFIQSSAADLLRYRRTIGAEHIQVWADIKKKHSAHAITADVSLAETAHAAEFMRADALIVTGAATGLQPSPADLAETKAAVHLPVYLGSGITATNLLEYAQADGYIVGSYFKAGGHWAADPDPERVRRFMGAWRALPPYGQ